MVSGIVFLALVLATLIVFTSIASRRIAARFPPVGPLVETSGGVIHVVQQAGEGSGRGAVLLVHGASGNFADMHVALADRLAGLGFQVFSVDRPGHGWSARLAGPDASSPLRQAAALREALTRLGVRDALVVVHSLAGALGLAMALDAPDFVRGLVLLAPVSHPWPGGVAWYYRLAAARSLGAAFRGLIVTPAGLATLRGGVRAVFDPNPTPDDYVARTRLPLMLRPAHFKANAEDVIDVQRRVATLSPRYREIRVPVAIVAGERDGVVSTELHAKACAREIPAARLTLLSGVGHSPHHSAPDSVVDAILDVEVRAEAARINEALAGQPR